MKKELNIKKLSLFFVVLGAAGCVVLAGCADQLPVSSSELEDDSAEFLVDDTAFERAREILEKYPEEELNDDATQVEREGDPEVPDEISGEDSGLDESGPAAIPEDEAARLMEFVDEATIEVLSEKTPSEKTPSEKTPNVKSPKQQNPVTERRFCDGDGVNEKTKKYDENVSDSCLLPKMRNAARHFNIRYTFARCIFEQENRSRDRLAHNNNGNGLAQIVNTTMKEINKRWIREDNLTVTFRQCLKTTSNRQDQYLNHIEKLEVPASYDKSDIFHEASRHPPTKRLNPLYRDDSLCMGMMTMGIKIQEARGRHSKGSVSDKELARRYNGSKNQRRYARAIVKCVERYKKSSSKLAIN